MGLIFDRIDHKNFADIKYILKSVYSKDLSLAYIEAKYDTSHTGVKYVATMAYEDDQPIGLYGAIPQRFSYKGQEILLVHTCDSFTIPSHQGKGIHRNLAKLSYDIMKQEGVKGVYAFHSENTYHSCKKLDWMDKYRMARFHIPTGAIPLTRVFNKLGWKNVIIKRANKYLTPFQMQDASNPHKGKFGGFHIYDNKFFQYKETFNKHWLIEVEGTQFYLKIDAVAHIGFFNVIDESFETFTKGLKKVKSLLKKIGVRELLFQVDPLSIQAKWLGELAPMQSSWMVGYLPFTDEIDFSDFAFNYCDFDTY